MKISKSNKAFLIDLINSKADLSSVEKLKAQLFEVDSFEERYELIAFLFCLTVPGAPIYDQIEALETY